MPIRVSGSKKDRDGWCRYLQASALGLAPMSLPSWGGAMTSSVQIPPLAQKQESGWWSRSGLHFRTNHNFLCVDSQTMFQFLSRGFLRKVPTPCFSSLTWVGNNASQAWEKSSLTCLNALHCFYFASPVLGGQSAALWFSNASKGSIPESKWESDLL